MKPLAISLAFLLLACSDQHPNQTKPPKALFDFSTPDNTIKSTWRVSTWKDTTQLDTSDFEFFTSSRLASERENKKQMMNTLRTKHPQNDNSITDVQIKSDSYAVVEAKEYFTIAQKDPSERRYILSKENGKWKIDDSQYKCFTCKGSGFEEDFDQKLSDIKQGLYRTNQKGNVLSAIRQDG